MSTALHNHQRLQFNTKMSRDRDFFYHTLKHKTEKKDCTLDNETFTSMSDLLFKNYRRRNLSKLLVLNSLMLPLLFLVLAGYYF